jgi:hypothetical protein
LVHSGSDSATEARVIVQRYGEAVKDNEPTLGNIDRRSDCYRIPTPGSNVIAASFRRSCVEIRGLRSLNFNIVTPLRVIDAFLRDGASAYLQARAFLTAIVSGYKQFQLESLRKVAWPFAEFNEVAAAANIRRR